MKIEEMLKGQIENHMLPFFWQHGEPEEKLREYVEAIYKTGVRQLCVESRPHPDFCGPDWWRDMDVIMEECRKRDMGVWVLDDSHFPTGYANGHAAGSPYRQLFLMEKHMDVQGPCKGTSILVDPDDPQGEGPRSRSVMEGILAVIAMRRVPGAVVDHSTFVNIHMVPVEGDTAIDLTDRIQDGMIAWDVPEGYWRVFIIEKTHEFRGMRKLPYASPLMDEGTDLLLEACYETHYQHYAADFGKTFRGFFSDEPTMGSAYTYHARLGHYPNLPIPWCKEMLEETGLSRCDLPALWYDIGTGTNAVRYRYMDKVSHRYEQHFTNRIGDWCRAHHVEYMGHVIEENNAHARLGHGTAHYFRALMGQDFSGIDIVLHEIIPGIKGTSHTWTSTPYEADDDFFYYMLAQMAASLAQLDPKKKGRAMCEIFGAFGWQEGLEEMKWQADFMLSRGINWFVPHAFTPKAFPDPDCPPHFYANGENPQYRYFHYLMDYMNRTASLISDGVHEAQVAVLYYAEAEWAGECMKTQVPVRVLTQRQIEADILPMDVLEEVRAQAGLFYVNQESYRALIIPYAQILPEKIVTICQRLFAGGVPVYFMNDLPERFVEKSSEQMTDEVLRQALRNVVQAPVTEERLIDVLCSDLDLTLLAEEFVPDLKVYPYRKDQKRFLLLFNEGIQNTIETTLRFNTTIRPVWYDAMDNRLEEAEVIEETMPEQKPGAGNNKKNIKVSVSLPPYTARFLVFDENPSGLSRMLSKETVKQYHAALAAKTEEIPDLFRISIARVTGDRPLVFEETKFTGTGAMNQPGKLPRFSGTFRYEESFQCADPQGHIILNLGEVGETAEVWVNGTHCGVRIAGPYRFDITKALRKGENELKIHVTNTLFYRQHDSLSMFQTIAPSGLIGPVKLEYFGE